MVPAKSVPAYGFSANIVEETIIGFRLGRIRDSRYIDILGVDGEDGYDVQDKFALIIVLHVCR